MSPTMPGPDSASDPAGPGDAARSDALIMYSLATCPTCVRARQEMDEQGVEYEERVLDDHPAYQQDVLRLTLQRTVPVFVKDARVVVGFHGERG